MWFSLASLLLANVLTNAAALPVLDNNSLQVRDRDISSPSIPEIVYSTASLGEEVRSIISRARVTKPKPKPKTPAKLNPANPNPKTPKKKPEPWEKPVPAESTISKKCKVPKDKAFFYSGTWPKAEQYGREAGLVMDVKAYPPRYVDLFSGRDGTPRNEAKRKLFSSRISRMYASKATGAVHVMVPWETGPDPNRFFHKDEWPILKKRINSGKITKIIQVNPDDFKETREYDPKRFGLSKRFNSLP